MATRDSRQVDRRGPDEHDVELGRRVGAPAGQGARTRERLLDAAFDRVANVGLAALALEDVASAADVSRQTLYRHFGSREGLIEALVLREEQWFIERVVAAAGDHDDAEPAVAAGVTAALAAATDHPLLQRLLETEPGAIVPLLVLGQGPVISAARPVVERLLRERLDLREADVAAMADVGSRLMISYVLDHTGEDPTVVGRRIARAVVGGLAGRSSPSGRPTS